MSLYLRTRMEESQVQESTTSHSSSSGVSFPTMGEQKKSGSAKTVLIVGILVLVAILGFVIYKSASSSGDEIQADATPFEDLTTPSSDQTVQTFTTSPSSTPAAVADKTKVEIQIQNGTGITGEAAYLQSQLTAMGYTNIKVGNSDSTVTATSVTFADSLESGAVTEITQKLNTIYQTVTTRTSPNATYDVVIVTGLRKGSSPRPSGSATPRASVTPTPNASATRSPSPTPSSTP